MLQCSLSLILTLSQDSSEWDLIEPSVISNDAQMKYRCCICCIFASILFIVHILFAEMVIPNVSLSTRMDLASGCYECRRTGLRIECSHDVQIEYLIRDWECVSDIPEMEHFTPCGPLMDIAIISGKLTAVYLPHFLCLGNFIIINRVK